MYICQLVWKKINQEITVVHKHNPILTEEKKNPSRYLKKIKTTNHCQKQHFGNEKIEKKLPIRTHFIFSV
jgi:hypothetical protein